MNRAAKIGLFLGSYSPLFILLALLEWNNTLLRSVAIFGTTVNILPLLFLGLTVVGIVITVAFLKVTRGIAPVNITPTVINGHSQETLAYLITYLIPFIGFKFVDGFAAVANVILFVMIGFLYVQSNMIYLNPLLSVMGYKIYKISINDKEKLMLAKKVVRDQTRVKAIMISEGIYIEPKN